MRRIVITVSAVALATLVVVICVRTASAQTNGSDNGKKGTVSVGVSSSSGSPGGSGSGSTVIHGGPAGPQCTYTMITTAEAEQANMPPGGPTPGNWYFVNCPGEELLIQNGGLVWIPTGTPIRPGPPAVTPEQVAAQAAASITLPSPVVATDPNQVTEANLATWVWIRAGFWHSRSVTASVDGVSATATATPVSVTYNMGDGGGFICNGPGTAYQPDVPAAQQHSSCTYTYRTSSAGQPSVDGNPDHGAFTVTATVTWSVSWVSVGSSGGGTSRHSKHPLQLTCGCSRCNRSALAEPTTDEGEQRCHAR